MINSLEIKAEMVRNDLTNKRLAELMDCSEQKVGRILKTKKCGTDDAIKITKILHLKDPAQIFLCE